MPVVLDNDTGERVLIYGADGSTLRQVVVDSAGRLSVVPRFTQVLTSSYEAAVGTHTETSRWSYTVPAGRIAYLEAIHAVIQATTALGDGRARVKITRSGGAAARSYELSSLIADNAFATLALALALAAGDVVAGFTVNSDASSRSFILNAFFREITL